MAYALGPLELLGGRSERGAARQRHLHLCPCEVVLRHRGEVVLDAGEQHLQGDRPGHRHRDAVDHAGRRSAAQLEPADGQLPGDRAGAEPGDDGLDDPGQQCGDADEQQDDAADHQVLVEVPVLPALPDHRVEHREPAKGQQQPPPQPAPCRPGRAHHAERLDDDAAQREQGDQHRRRRNREGDQRGQPRRGVHVAGEHADVENLDGARDLAADQEEDRAEAEPDHGTRERLTGGDPPGHPAVGADQAQRREPAVAPLAAEPYGRGDEDADRRKQHHEHDDDQQDQYGIHPLGRGQRIPELVDADHLAAVDLRCQSLAARVEGEFGRADETGLADGADGAVRQPLAQQLPAVRLQQLVQRGETTISPGAGNLSTPGGSGARGPSGSNCRPRTSFSR